MSSNHDGDSLDFQNIEKELHQAVQSDEKYWRENDAKFRAVNQKVGSYEEFRDIVKAAHIKPLEKEDKGLTAAPAPWNAIASKEKGDKNKTNNSELKKIDHTIPKNSQEFVRDWRRYYKTTHEQYSFLLQVGGSELGRIFKTEVCLLGDILLALLEFKEEDHSKVLCILQNIAKANRFSLAIQFLNSKEKDTCHQLFEKLQQKRNSDVNADDCNEDRETQTNLTDLTDLKRVYEIKK